MWSEGACATGCTGISKSSYHMVLPSNDPVVRGCATRTEGLPMENRLLVPSSLYRTSSANAGRQEPRASAQGSSSRRLYVCTYIYIYIYISLSLSIYIYIYIEVCVCIYIYIYIYTHINTNMCVYISLSISLSLYIYIYIHVCIYIYIYIYTCICKSNISHLFI